MAFRQHLASLELPRWKGNFVYLISDYYGIYCCMKAVSIPGICPWCATLAMWSFCKLRIFSAWVCFRAHIFCRNACPPCCYLFLLNFSITIQPSWGSQSANGSCRICFPLFLYNTINITTSWKSSGEFLIVNVNIITPWTIPRGCLISGTSRCAGRSHYSRNSPLNPGSTPFIQYL